MFPKQNRLDRKDFSEILKKGRRIRGNSFSLIFANFGNGGAQIGIIITKKVTKTAVERNKLKRRIRNILIPELNNLPQGLKIIIMVYPSQEKLLFNSIKTEVLGLINRLAITSSQ